MSNPDLPGPYWQDQDDADRGAGWRSAQEGSRRADSPWDDGAFWRDDRGNGSDRGSRRAGNGRTSDGRTGDGRTGNGPTGNGRSGGRRAGAGESWSEMLAGRSRRAAQRGSRARGERDADSAFDPRSGTDRDSSGRGGRFSQTADDLRSRLGVRAGGAGRRGVSGRSSSGADPKPSGARRLPRAGGARAAHSGDYGDYGDEGTIGARSRTALREHSGDFWADDDPAGRGSRSKVTELPGTRRGGSGGGGGGRGRGGHGGGGRGDDGRPRSRGERFTDWLLYGSWWRHWTWKKLLFVLGGGFAAFVILAIIGIAVAYTMTPIPTDVSQTATWQSSSVYFSNGKLLGTFTNSQDINRQLLTTAQIPQSVENAVIAAEDRNFYHEGGISIPGIVRSAYDDLFGSGTSLQGGSTITEQYAKNYYANIGASRTITTKVKEIFVAIKLAHSRSKPWILTNYLNTVPFGSNVYGVWAAAEDYFGINLAKNGAHLSNAQAAMLGAMPNNPAVFNPDPKAGVGYTLLVQRWQYVLTNMVRDGAMTQAEATSLCYKCALPDAEKAFNKSIQLNEGSGSNGWTGTTGYLMQMVQQELESTYHLSLAKIQTGGLRITTTFSPSMMQGLTRAVNAEKKQMAAAGVPLPYYDHFGISLEDPKTGALLAIYGGPGYISNQKKCRRLFCQYNMAEAPHPVGSSMKPYVLAAAINQGMDVQTSVLNGFSPLWIPPEYTAADKAMLSLRQPPPMGAAAAKSVGWWESQGEASMGPISVSVAAAQSSDPAFTDLAHRVGVTSIIGTAQAFGVGSNPFNLGNNDLQGLNALFGPKGSISGSVQIALGQGDLTPIEQASTFATLMDGGVYHAPHVISKLSGWTPGGQQAIPLKIATHIVMSQAAAADEDYALSFDTINGTGYPNATWPGRPVIGKTGTLGNGNLASEAWFVGAIPQYAMAIGLWTNTQAQNLDNLPSLGGIGGSFGGAWPAATWKAFMTNKFANLTVEQLPTPNYAGFTKWIQVAPQAPRKQVCQPGQWQGCRCKKNQNCQPNPTTSCQQGGFGQPCNTSPSPQPSCGGGGQNCSPSPTPSPPTCPPQGPPCGGVATGPTTTTARLSAGSSGSTALTAALLSAEEAIAAGAWRLRVPLL